LEEFLDSAHSPFLRFGSVGYLVTRFRRSTVLATLASLAAMSPLGAAAGAIGIDLESVVYPFPVAFLPLVLEATDVRMAYMDVAPQGRANGKTVVLLHGKNFCGLYWERTIREAGAHGYRVVVPDQIGWGKSSKPAIAYSFDGLAKNTALLLDTLGLRRVSIVGHSTGGMLATRFARMYPDRVERLVLQDSIGMEDYRRVIAPLSFEALYAQELRLDPSAIRRVFANYLADPARLGLFSREIEIEIGVLASADYPVRARASALAYRMIYEQPVCYEYDLIAAPSLVVAGAADHTAPLATFAEPADRPKLGRIAALAERTARALQDGRFVEIPDCGHVPHVERPATFLPALFDFLRRDNERAQL
jgi:pimeloyl-ACP methyl ester carboxylesterase